MRLDNRLGDFLQRIERVSLLMYRLIDSTELALTKLLAETKITNSNFTVKFLCFLITWWWEVFWECVLLLFFCWLCRCFATSVIVTCVLISLVAIITREFVLFQETGRNWRIIISLFPVIIFFLCCIILLLKLIRLFFKLILPLWCIRSTISLLLSKVTTTIFLLVILLLITTILLLIVVCCGWIVTICTVLFYLAWDRACVEAGLIVVSWSRRWRWRWRWERATEFLWRYQAW